jgi:alginate O-acetyltransferase complex protein AlgJ
VIFFPLLNGILPILPDIKSFENRQYASRPPFKLEHLDPFPAAYESYYNDHFNLRSRLIVAYNIFKVLVFHISPVPKVLIGKDGWLFGTGEDVDAATGRDPLTEQELSKIAAELESRRLRLEREGRGFYFMIAPCKASVYTDKLGHGHRRAPVTWGEQLLAFLRARTRVQVIDLFQLYQQQRQQDLYYKIDSHWTDLAALYAANSAFTVMSQQLKGLRQLNPADFEAQETGMPENNFANMLGNLPWFREKQFRLVRRGRFEATVADKRGYQPPHGFAYGWEYENVRQKADTTGPRLLIISDSFGNAIFPFLAENFSRTVKIFDAWQYGSNDSIVRNERADAVLLIIHEPILRSLVPTQSASRK